MYLASPSCTEVVIACETMELGVPGGYLQALQALLLSLARDAQRPRGPVRLLPGNCCSVYPTYGGSAWLLHALLPDPGPVGPGGPSAAWSQTDKTDRRKLVSSFRRSRKNTHSSYAKLNYTFPVSVIFSRYSRCSLPLLGRYLRNKKHLTHNFFFSQVILLTK